MNRKDLNKQYKDWFSRSATIRTESVKAEDMIIEKGVLATEQPVIVFDWYRWEPVREILLMKGCRIPENGQVPLLDSHSRYSTEEIKGSVRNIVDGVDEKGEPIILGDYHFEREAKREFNMVQDEHLTDTSIGYKTYDEHTIVVAPKERTEIDGKEYRNDYGDDFTLLIREVWDLKEDSLVAIGADDRAKFRSEFIDLNNFPVKNLNNVDPKEIDGIKNSIKELNNSVTKIISIKGDGPMTEEEKKKFADEAIGKNRIREEKINDFAGKFKGQFKDEKAATERAINENWDVNKFRDYVLDNLNNGGAVETPATEIGMTNQEAIDFSITKALDAVLNKDWSKAGKEKEALDTVHKKVEPKNGGIVLPREVQLVGANTANNLNANFRLALALNNREMMERALQVATDSAGGYLVGTENKGDAFIEMLRNKSVLGQARITILSGQKEDLDIPKQVGSATFSMVGEGGAANQSFLTLGHVTSTPKTGTITTEYTRRLLSRSNPAIDGLVLSDILALNRNGLDNKGLHGTGVGNDPEGIANVTGVGTVDMSTPSWPKIVEFETDVEDANADINSMGWITNPLVKGKMKTVLRETGTGNYLMNDSGLMNNYPSHITKNANSQHLFFGVWNQLILVEYGILELLVNPYGENSRAGNVEVTSFIDFDYICRHAAAFSISSNVGL